MTKAHGGPTHHKRGDAEGGGGGRGGGSEDLGLPRMIARIWGLVAGICKFVCLYVETVRDGSY